MPYGIEAARRCGDNVLRAHVLWRGHHPLAHVAVKLIVAGEGNDPLRKRHLAQLEPGHAHFYARRFGLYVIWN